MRKAAAVFLVPGLIALICVAGLISALTGNGLPDIISWAALAVPIAAIGWAMLARRT